MCRLGTEAVQDANRVIEDALSRAGTASSEASLAPGTTDVVGVEHMKAEALHLILVRRHDYRSPRALAIGSVVVFSEPTYAVFRTEQLQLATLSADQLIELGVSAGCNPAPARLSLVRPSPSQCETKN